MQPSVRTTFFADLGVPMHGIENHLTRRFSGAIIATLAIAFAIGAMCLIMPAQAHAAKAVDSYSYSVTPILKPFNSYLYVQTDNPDPDSFRLLDKQSVYFENEQLSEYESRTPGAFEASPYLYPDVKYEKEATHRVKGGYIFNGALADSDGGSLSLQKREGGEWTDTGVSVKCPVLKTRTDYLIDEYTTSSMSFFEKLDAVQAAMEELCVYPANVFDSNKLCDATPYPFLMASSYPESTPSVTDASHEYLVSGVMLQELNPFVLDSQGFPGAMASVARRLDPDCVVSQGTTHEKRDITHNGTTKTYGGAGDGSPINLLSDLVTKIFTFDGSSSDLGTHASVSALNDAQKAVVAKGTADWEKMRDDVRGEAFANTVKGGSWIRMGMDSFALGSAPAKVYGFAADLYYQEHKQDTNEGDRNAVILSDTWVDGRYIGARETWEPLAKFKEHATSNIALQDLMFKDSDGKSRTASLVIFSYASDLDMWVARTMAYRAGYDMYDYDSYPKELKLTRAQAEALKVDRNTARLPESGFIYDSSAKPGTPFSVTYPTAISVKKSEKLPLGSSIRFEAASGGNEDGWAGSISVSPKDAKLGVFQVESSDESVVSVDGVRITGEKLGTATITVRSLDPELTAKMQITVTKPVESVSFTKGTVSLEVGGSTKLEYSVKPADSVATDVVYSSSDESIATVSDDGVVKGVSAGDTHVTVWVGDAYDYCNVSVRKSPTSVKIDEASLDLDIGETRSVHATITPDDASADSLVWASEDESIVSISEGNGTQYASLTGVKKGKTRVSLTSSTGQTSYCAINVGGASQEGESATEKPGSSGEGSGSKSDASVKPDDPSSVLPSGWHHDKAWARLAGQDALETMWKIVEEGQFSTGGTVVLATVDGYWDALTAAGIAGLTDAPVLMTSGSALSEAAASQLYMLQPKTLVVCGGTAAVSDKVASDAAFVANGATVVRCAGKTATDTAVKVFQKAKTELGKTWSDTAFVCTNDGYWDALAAAPVSYAKGMPIFLTEGAGTIDPVVMKAMKDGGIKKVHIVGGEMAVKPAVAKQLSGAGLEVLERLSGQTAIETSEKVATFGLSLGMDADLVGVATNGGYWDALSGAALCGKNNTVLVLVENERSNSITGFLKSHAGTIAHGYVFGGTAVITEKTFNACMNATK